MVKSAYFKILLRTFKKHIARLLSIAAIVLVSVGFVSGICSFSGMLNPSLENFYKDRVVSDFIIKDTSGAGFSEEDISKISEYFEGANIDTGLSMDIQKSEKRSERLIFLDLQNQTVNKPVLISGSAPESPFEVYAENPDNFIKGYNVGEEVQVNLFGHDFTFKVSGVIQSPLTISNSGEPSYNNGDISFGLTVSGTKDLDVLENILYIPKDALNLPTGDIYVAIKDRDLYDSFSKGYESYVEKVKSDLKENLPNARVLSLYDNFGFRSLDNYGEKVDEIGYIVMIAFLAVSALVALTTMTRFLEEERAQIACLQTLGFSPFKIISKYLLFAFVGTLIGGFGSYFVGYGLTRFIYFVFDYSFYMPPVIENFALTLFAAVLALIVASTLAATAIAGFRMIREAPANLLRPKPPRAGKKVILEKVPFLWNRLSFKHKSTFRNVLRYKSRFFMTVIAIAVSMGLILAGLALFDMCLFTDFGSSAIMGISILLMVFAGLLTSVVIYTLTNINVSERNREIATLMVLGYYDNEVTGYIYREVYLNSFVGIIFGYPVGIALIELVFSVMSVGNIANLSWFMWLVAPVLTLAFTALVTLLLHRKILGIDMNDSLKAIE